jgi:hypothetical protein
MLLFNASQPRVWANLYQFLGTVSIQLQSIPIQYVNEICTDVALGGLRQVSPQP